jgi:hypothetical protein
VTVGQDVRRAGPRCGVQGPERSTVWRSDWQWLPQCARRRRRRRSARRRRRRLRCSRRCRPRRRRKRHTRALLTYSTSSTASPATPLTSPRPPHPAPQTLLHSSARNTQAHWRWQPRPHFPSHTRRRLCPRLHRPRRGHRWRPFTYCQTAAARRRPRQASSNGVSPSLSPRLHGLCLRLPGPFEMTQPSGRSPQTGSTQPPHPQPQASPAHASAWMQTPASTRTSSRCSTPRPRLRSSRTGRRKSGASGRPRRPRRSSPAANPCAFHCSHTFICADGRAYSMASATGRPCSRTRT